jgi:hypothetical protein
MHATDRAMRSGALRRYKAGCILPYSLPCKKARAFVLQGMMRPTPGEPRLVGQEDTVSPRRFPQANAGALLAECLLSTVVDMPRCMQWWQWA